MKRKLHTSPAQGTFLIREDVPLKPGSEVHVAGVCVRNTDGGAWEVLIAKRTSRRQICPGLWECGGGRVNPNEGFEDAIKRKIFEEFGIDAEVIELLETYKIQVRGKPIIPGVRFLCVAGTESIKLNRREFSRHQWVAFPVPNDLQYIDGVKKVLDHLAAELVPTATKKGPKSVGLVAVPQSETIQ